MCRKYLRAALFALLFAPLFSACYKNKGMEIPLDNSDPLALAPDVQWAVVTVPYAAFREETSWNAQAASYCKQGEFFAVKASTSIAIEGKNENWYLFDDGWLPESAVSIYPNKLRAAKASEQLK